MSAIKWVLICAILNVTAIVTAALLAAFTNFSHGAVLMIGAFLIVASVLPFTKAQQAYAAERTDGHA